MLLSVLWFVFATKVMAVLSGEERTAYLSLYSRWGNTPLQIVVSILTHPIDAIKTLIFCEGHFTQPGTYPLLLLAPFAFFPLFSGTFALFALPNYAVLALSDWRAMRELGFQHASIIALGLRHRYLLLSAGYKNSWMKTCNFNGKKLWSLPFPSA